MTKRFAMNLKAGDRILFEGRAVTLATVSEPFQHEALDTYQIRISTADAPDTYHRLRAAQEVALAA